jgi:hypothetical protein
VGASNETKTTTQAELATVVVMRLGGAVVSGSADIRGVTAAKYKKGLVYVRVNA